MSIPNMSMPVTTTFTIEGYRIRQYLGVVRGLIVRAPTISQGIMGGLKSIIGGNIGAYTEMCEQTRQQAYDLLIDHARGLGANAIVGLRYDASEIGGKAKLSRTVCTEGFGKILAESGKTTAAAAIATLPSTAERGIFAACDTNVCNRAAAC